MKNSKSGFSLIEVVVAFALIVLVSVTAFSIFETSGNNILSAVDEKQAVGYLDNALELYKFYGDDDGVISELGLSDSDKSDGYYQKRFGGYTVKFKIDETEGFQGDCYAGDRLVVGISPYLKGVADENP